MHRKHTHTHTQRKHTPTHNNTDALIYSCALKEQLKTYKHPNLGATWQRTPCCLPLFTAELICYSRQGIRFLLKGNLQRRKQCCIMGTTAVVEAGLSQKLTNNFHYSSAKWKFKAELDTHIQTLRQRLVFCQTGCERGQVNKTEAEFTVSHSAFQTCHF